MKDRIDHSNYEAWLLDRLEGTLTEAQERLLDAFLLRHPELVPEEGELPIVPGERSGPIHFDKDALKRQVPPAGPVTEHNVLDHLIAQAEGDLDRENEKALQEFVEAYPQYQRDARIVAFTKTAHQPLKYPATSELHRHVPPVGMPNAYNADDFLIARAEGDLDEQQEAAVAAFVAAHPEAQRAWHVTELAKVSATAMVYPDKAGLKKGGRVIAFASRSWVRLSAAASILLVLGMGLWYLNSPPPLSTRIAELPTRVNSVEPKSGDLEVVRQGSSQHAESMPIAEVGAGAAVARTDEDNVGAQQGASNEPPSPRTTRTTMPRLQRVDPVRPMDPSIPVSVEVADVPVSNEDPNTGWITPAKASPTMTVPELFAFTVRERVLEEPASDPRPLDRDDAVAMVDRGLKAVGGNDTGLDLERGDGGRVRSFDLRLGRNLAISARR